MRFKAFNARYKMIAPFKRLKRADDKALDDCTLILQSFQANTSLQLPKDSNVSTSWSLGKRHIFLRFGRLQIEFLMTISHYIDNINFVFSTSTDDIQ